MARFRVCAGTGKEFPFIVLFGFLMFSAVSGLAADHNAKSPIGEPRQAERSAGSHREGGKLLSKMSLFFVPNSGQADPSAHFEARGHGYELDLRENALAITPLAGHKTGPTPTPVVLQFAGANPAAKLEGASPWGARINYIILAQMAFP